MTRTVRALARTTMIAACLALGVASISLAQGRGGGGPPPGGGGPGGGGGMGGPGGGGMGGPQFPGGGQPMNRGPMGTTEPQPGQRGQLGENPARPGLQLGPAGRWWDDKSMAKNLKLRPDQQAHMDAIFEQNRGMLLARLQGVQQAETQMMELAKAPTLDEAALFAQIDRIAQARADLEKANTHMLLQMRKEMDADQIKRLEKASQR